MIYETYKESGKVPVPGLILYIVLGLFGSYLILSAYCQFICSFPAVLFRLAGMAVSLFLICLWLVFLCGLAKIRRSRLVRILTLVMLLAAYYASRGVYITLVKDLWQYGSNEVYKQASASDSFRAAIRLWFVRPISLWIHPYQILKGLYEILPIGVGDSGRKTLHGVWLLIFWLLEFQLLMTLPPYLAQKRSQRPFDEINKTWNPSPETWTVTYVEDYRRIITALRRKEPKPLVEALQEMKAYKVEGEESFALISFSHRRGRTGPYITLVNIKAVQSGPVRIDHRRIVLCRVFNIGAHQAGLLREKIASQARDLGIDSRQWRKLEWKERIRNLVYPSGKGSSRDLSSQQPEQTQTKVWHPSEDEEITVHVPRITPEMEKAYREREKIHHKN